MDTNHIQASRVGKDSHVPYHKMSSDMFRLTVLILLVWGLVLTGCGAKSESKREKGLALDLAEINENLVKQGDRSGVLEAEQSAREKREDRPDVKSLSFFKDGKNSDLADIPGSKEERRGTDAGKRVDQEEGILLNFNNADIYEVIKVIAEALDLNYIIDPQVKGVVNIHSGKKIPYSELFAVFKKILHINGLDISKEEDYYYIHMAKKASPDQVYGPDNVDELKDSSRQVIQVIPLFYIPAAEAMDLLNPYLSAQGGVYSLGSQNTLIISDYESKVADALRILAKLDTASLASMEVQLVRIDEAPVSKLKEELDEILQALKVNAEPLQGVAVIPLARINSLLLVGISEENVTMARRWINELDVMPASDQDSIYVYNVRNSVASKLADLVKQLISEEEPVSDKENHQDDRNKAHPGRKPPLSSLGFKGSPVIFADDDRNMVLIRGLAPDYKRVVRILEKLDTLPRQVLVEVILAELTLKNELSFGIEWAFHNQNISKGGQDYRQDFISNLADLVYSDAEGVPGFTYALSKGRNVYGLLQTLASPN
ncbi:MAG: secretin N-terminal domain-containing protein, partial [Thermodesulfobacteriota bacterium]